MTEAFKDKSFFVPLSKDKSEGVFVRPVTATLRRQVQQEAIKEAGADTSIAEFYAVVKLLQKGLTGWQGFVDMTGGEIPFSAEMVKELCECDPDFMAGLATRIQHVARMGELEDRKN